MREVPIRSRLALALCSLAFLAPHCNGDPHWSAVAYGDSITSEPNTGSKWCTRLPAPRACEPRGQGGEITADGVNRLLADLAAGAVPTADYVVLAWGTNDVKFASFDPQRDVLDPIRTAAEALLAAGMRPVLWVPPPWMTFDDPPQCCGDAQNARIALLRKALLALAKELGLPAIDAFDFFMAQPDVASLFKDHVHPTTRNPDGGPVGQLLLVDVVVFTLDYAPH